MWHGVAWGMMCYDDVVWRLRAGVPQALARHRLVNDALQEMVDRGSSPGLPGQFGAAMSPSHMWSRGGVGQGVPSLGSPSPAPTPAQGTGPMAGPGSPIMRQATLARAMSQARALSLMVSPKGTADAPSGAVDGEGTTPGGPGAREPGSASGTFVTVAAGGGSTGSGGPTTRSLGGASLSGVAPPAPPAPPASGSGGGPPRGRPVGAAGAAGAAGGVVDEEEEEEDGGADGGVAPWPRGPQSTMSPETLRRLSTPRMDRSVSPRLRNRVIDANDVTGARGSASCRRGCLRLFCREA